LAGAPTAKVNYTPGAEGVVELSPGVVKRRGADAQPVGAQDPDRDAG
jgi:hypothetical protein